MFADVPRCFGRLSVPGGTVCGVAQLGDDIFVACESSRLIAVFTWDGRESFTRTDDIDLTQLRTPPLDVAASSEHRRLFVADDSNHCVWQLDR